MQFLVPFVVASDVVDRYDIWVNTHNGADIEFFRKLSEAFPVINLVWQPDGVVNGIASINAFYRSCVEERTIYFKLDDDIVWMEPDLIKKMLDFRIDYPDYFLVSPLVINNSLTTYLLQIEDKLTLDRYCNANASHTILWHSGKFAASLHKWFIENYLKKNQWQKLYMGKKEMSMTRFSINSVLWFGDEMRSFAGIVPGDDEEFLSCIYPSLKGKSNAWNGNDILAHFAFFPQREELDSQGILEKYAAILSDQWEKSDGIRDVYHKVARIMTWIRENERNLLKVPSPYRKLLKKRSFRDRIKKLVPEIILDAISSLRKREEASIMGGI